MSTTRTLIAEQEGNNEVCGIRVGYSVHAVACSRCSAGTCTEHDFAGQGDRFEVTVRNRTYDGIRVASKHDTDPIRLAATEKAAAIEEGRGHALAMIRFLRSMEESA